VALKGLTVNLPTSEQNLPRALTFALISLVLGPPDERDRNLETIEEICKTASLQDAANN
jgi:hypothetical protein